MDKDIHFTSFRDCQNELIRLTKIPTGRERCTVSDPVAAANSVHQASLDLLHYGPGENESPPVQSTIARLVLQLAGYAGHIRPLMQFDGDDHIQPGISYFPRINALACSQSEHRLVQSLAWLDNNEKKQRPACILSDAETDMPFAYQKNRGTPIAFAWRDGYLATSEGWRWVPADTIFRPLYKSFDPCKPHPESLLAIPSTDIRDAHFMRFMISSWLPMELRRRIVQEGVGREKRAVDPDYIKKAAAIDATMLEQLVQPHISRAAAL